MDNKEIQKQLESLMLALSTNNEQQIRLMIEKMGEAKQCSVEIKFNSKKDTEFTVKAYGEDTRLARIAASKTYDALVNKYHIGLEDEVAAKLSESENKAYEATQRIDIPKEIKTSNKKEAEDVGTKSK